jgi:prepilin-type N-terminal cleavage/methylation domain-containing protein
MDQRQKKRAGLTLTEVLCVMAIILILAALYLPALAKAYHRIRVFLGGMSG